MLQFYLDENVSPEIGQQLRRRGIEVIIPQEIETLGDSDLNHLQRATEMNCVLCTHDTDFLRLASEGINHSGIVFGVQMDSKIGKWVIFLEILHSRYSIEEMYNNIMYVP